MQATAERLSAPLVTVSWQVLLRRRLDDSRRCLKAESFLYLHIGYLWPSSSLFRNLMTADLGGELFRVKKIWDKLGSTE